MDDKISVDAIYETLRDRICIGDYPSGYVLREGSLGDEFGVSRTPIRQALQRLACQKLAVVRIGVGTIVQGILTTTVSGYLEVQAGLLSSVSRTGLTADVTDMEELVATVYLRATRLQAKTELERFWPVLKGLQEVSNQLISDDRMQYVDELLFYSTAPAIMHGAYATPLDAATILCQSVADVIGPLEDEDYEAFFAAHACNVARYGDLLIPSLCANQPCAARLCASLV